MMNFNNPSKHPYNNTYSVVSATLDNPAVQNSVPYGDFSSADKELNQYLPKILNLGQNNGNNGNKKPVAGHNNLNIGITSPGFIDDAYKACSGLDFMNTNPDYDNLPFQVCLDKFSTQYRIPEQVFNNLMNNLPYTFSALSDSEKQRYLNKLEKFVNSNSNNNRLLNGNNFGNDNKLDLTGPPGPPAPLEGSTPPDLLKHHGKGHGKHHHKKHHHDNDNNSLSLSASLSIILIIIVLLVLLMCYLQK